MLHRGEPGWPAVCCRGEIDLHAFLVHEIACEGHIVWCERLPSPTLVITPPADSLSQHIKLPILPTPVATTGKLSVPSPPSLLSPSRSLFTPPVGFVASP